MNVLLLMAAEPEFIPLTHCDSKLVRHTMARAAFFLARASILAENFGEIEVKLDPHRFTYEQGVLHWLDRHMVRCDPGWRYNGNRIVVEDVKLEPTDHGSEEKSVVVLFRETSRPECVFGYRTLASEYYGDGVATPEFEAKVIYTNLEEIIEARGSVLPEDCKPDVVTWVR